MKLTQISKYTYGYWYNILIDAIYHKNVCIEFDTTLGMGSKSKLLILLPMFFLAVLPPRCMGITLQTMERYNLTWIIVLELFAQIKTFYFANDY